MKVEVILTDKSNDYVDKVLVDNVKDKHNFTYEDNDSNICQISIYENGLVLNKNGKDYNLLLDLRDPSFAIISSSEGNVELLVKVVDFIEKNDIFIVHYLIDSDLREILIRYRS